VSSVICTLNKCLFYSNHYHNNSHYIIMHAGCLQRPYSGKVCWDASMSYRYSMPAVTQFTEGANTLISLAQAHPVVMRELFVAGMAGTDTCKFLSAVRHRVVRKWLKPQTTRRRNNIRLGTVSAEM